MTYQFFVPTRTLFGAGVLNDLHKQTMPGKKALVVISNGKSMKATGTLARLLQQLNEAAVETVVFDKVEANPLRSTVMAGADCAKANGCDFVVALGGGSVMDAAKAIASIAVNDGDIWDYINGGTGGGKTLANKALPLICVTTTAGTGSEADQWGVITNDATNEKIGFGGYDFLFPVLSVIDPELMVSVPPTFTAYQGFDALFHSTECYISKFHNLMGDMLALTAIENVGKYLARAVKNGNDLEAREGMAFANNLSGQVMTVSCCTSEHSMEHAMSAYHQQLPHGAGLIMLSAAYYQHFVDCHACDERFITMAKALGKKDASTAQDFITALVQLQKDCGVDDLKMSAYGIEESELGNLAHNARATMGGLFAADPKELTDADCTEIYRKAYK
ncbi:iron-containing alcohol dehydrogenase [uncultured Phascolarctobacterium sp.]|uniref:iron-containing alcohol dehydrogenase n=1 Tax=uncultured Phascolarctobacterium sp. TaxID=512296 RepID=UPI00262B9A54|nr:iron-containing alcohol dehydrogenase [uncultured Phascolarctobacterium sp.]